MEQIYIPKQDYKVLVHTITYNQAKYITDTLDGVAMQQTDFPFVHYVIDDCSTDGEQDVIKNWLNEHCDMGKAEYIDLELANVILVHHKTNLYLSYAIYFLKRNLYKEKAAKIKLVKPWRDHCEYEAFCEGDDYWTEPKKIQFQSDWLDTNPIYSGIASNTIKIKEDKTPVGLFSTKSSRDIVSLSEIIAERQFHYAALMFKIEKYNNSPDECVDSTWDTFTWCCLLTQGPIRYQNTISCVYRLGSGVTTNTPNMKWIMIQEKWANMLYSSFSPKYISYEDAYFPLISDVLSILTNNKCTKAERENLHKLLRQYMKLTLFWKLVPILLSSVKSFIKKFFSKIYD